MPAEDDELFQRMMADVKPLVTEQRINPQAPRPKPRPRNQTPDHQTSSTRTGFIEHQHVPAMGADESLFFARSGPQQRLLRQFKRGDMPLEARLDLHGHTIAEAGRVLGEFLSEAEQAGLRCVIVVHGKGQRSADARPVLKSQVNQWLRDTPTVLAFSSAQPKHGGTGALYVLLRRGLQGQASA
jgi:DNA-nicking Smr family endonuclease